MFWVADPETGQLPRHVAQEPGSVQLDQVELLLSGEDGIRGDDTGGPVIAVGSLLESARLFLAVTRSFGAFVRK